MAERSHLSIGEVLSLLQDDFPDVTISKIRFLESQGLLDPERTPSGYRKFYEADIDRLRWILRQQRENFLPLKVIRDRLDDADRKGLVVPPEPDGGPGPGGAETLPGLAAESTAAGPVTDPAGDARAPVEPEPAPVTAPAVAAPATAAPSPGPAPSTPAAAAPSPRPSRPVPAGPSRSPSGAGSPLDPGPSEVSLTLAELAEATGLDEAALGQLERFGLLSGQAVGADTYYDGDALVVARTAAGFLRYGIEARHLRMYKVAAEREAGFFEQVVMPLLKQRNPTARQQATDTLGDLAALGETLRAALLRASLADHRS
jgi:DNA-binding transcriptional MerR regulator